MRLHPQSELRRKHTDISGRKEDRASITGEVTDSATERPGSTTDSVSATIRSGGAANTLKSGGKTVEESSQGAPTESAEVPPVVVTGTKVKEVPG